jgi:hypothetical protein
LCWADGKGHLWVSLNEPPNDTCDGLIVADYELYLIGSGIFQYTDKSKTFNFMFFKVLTGLTQLI